jgi:hypothetical protein
MEPRVSRRGFTFECGEWTLFSEMREGLLFPMGAVYGRQSGRVACNRGRAGLGPARGKVAQFKKQRCKKLQCKRMLGERARGKNIRGKKMLRQENASAGIYLLGDVNPEVAGSQSLGMRVMWSTKLR